MLDGRAEARRRAATRGARRIARRLAAPLPGVQGLVDGDFGLGALSPHLPILDARPFHVLASGARGGRGGAERGASGAVARGDMREAATGADGTAARAAGRAAVDAAPGSRARRGGPPDAVRDGRGEAGRAEPGRESMRAVPPAGLVAQPRPPGRGALPPPPERRGGLLDGVVLPLAAGRRRPGLPETEPTSRRGGKERGVKSELPSASADGGTHTGRSSAPAAAGNRRGGRGAVESPPGRGPLEGAVTGQTEGRQSPVVGNDGAEGPGAEPIGAGAALLDTLSRKVMARRAAAARSQPEVHPVGRAESSRSGALGAATALPQPSSTAPAVEDVISQRASASTRVAWGGVSPRITGEAASAPSGAASRAAPDLSTADHPLPLDATTIADLVNDALVEQARRNGVDLV